MKLVTSVGYTDTGSSAINDLLMEYKGFCKLTPKNECRFLQDPDGISDLEYHLFENRHRLNSGYAIKRYLKLALKYDKRNYYQIFGKEWEKYTIDYVNNITNMKYKAYWHADIRDLNLLTKGVYFFKRGLRIILNKILPKNYRIPNYYNFLPHIYTYNPIIDKTEFLKATKQYCTSLFESINTTQEEFGIIDQLVPPSNVGRYIRYVNNLKVIIVDRDPRDVYIENIVLKDHILPKDLKEFCQVYRESRTDQQFIQMDNVLFIKFEDLIYNYDSIVKKITKFVGIDEKDHLRKKEIFNPDISIKNTRLWEKYQMFEDDIKYIENNLKEYIYDYKRG